MFHLMFSLPWLIVATRFIAPLPWPWMVKLLLAAFLLLASQYHLFSRFTSGSVFAPEFPRPLVIGFNLFFGAIVLLAAMQVVLDLVSILILAVKWSFPVVPAEVRYTMGVAALVLAAFGISQAIRVPPVKKIEVAIPGLAAEFDGYRMVQLTDLHISRLFTGRWASAVVEKTNALDADLIVITGDLIDGSLDIRREDVAPLAGLSARDGVLTVPGNHEYFFEVDRWLAHFPELNMRILANEHAVIERGKRLSSRFGLTAADRPQLVGLKPVDRDKSFAAGAHLLKENVKPSTLNDQGWVSSVCHSPTLGHTIGLAFLKSGRERLGEKIVVWDGLRGGEVLAEVVSPVFYDPDNKKLNL